MLSDLGNNSLGLLLHRLVPEQAQIWVILAFPAWCIEIHDFQTDDRQSSNPTQTSIYKFQCSKQTEIDLDTPEKFQNNRIIFLKAHIRPKSVHSQAFEAIVNSSGKYIITLIDRDMKEVDNITSIRSRDEGKLVDTKSSVLIPTFQN